LIKHTKKKTTKGKITSYSDIKINNFYSLKDVTVNKRRNRRQSTACKKILATSSNNRRTFTVRILIKTPMHQKGQVNQFSRKISKRHEQAFLRKWKSL
jgi:hypothetical protein